MDEVAATFGDREAYVEGDQRVTFGEWLARADLLAAEFIRRGVRRGDVVALMLPGARVIYCDRDPRDIGLSIFTYRFYGSHGYAHDLSDLGWYIGQHDRLMAHWKQALPNPILEVRLSDWVEDFGATLARVLAHLDLPPDIPFAGNGSASLPRGFSARNIDRPR